VRPESEPVLPSWRSRSAYRRQSALTSGWRIVLIHLCQISLNSFSIFVCLHWSPRLWIVFVRFSRQSHKSYEFVDKTIIWIIVWIHLTIVCGLYYRLNDWIFISLLSDTSFGFKLQSIESLNETLSDEYCNNGRPNQCFSFIKHYSVFL